MIAACNRLVLLVNASKIGQVCQQLLPISAVERGLPVKGSSRFISHLRTLGSSPQGRTQETHAGATIEMLSRTDIGISTVSSLYREW
jgi:hypothetical protein